MTDQSSVLEDYISLYQTQKPSLLANGAEWEGAFRDRAVSNLKEQGFPTVKDEPWKYFNVSPLIDEIPSVPENQVAWETLEDKFPTIENAIVVKVSNGKSKLSEGLPKGVEILDLKDAIKAQPKIGELFQQEKFADGFVALNAAFWQSGIYVRVAEGVTVERPIHIIYASEPGSQYGFSPIRNIVLLEKNTKAKLIESYVGREGKYLSNISSKYILNKDSQLTHTTIQNESDEAFHLDSAAVEIEANANYKSTHVTLGGARARTSRDVHFNGPHAVADLGGAYLTGEDHYVGHVIDLDHCSPHCNSNQTFKGILWGKARGVFNGKVTVSPGAQKTNAEQSNKNLLLSDDAEADSRPQLEIYADDVKCSHGATVGQLDDEAVFYLVSRGIGREEARTMLTEAFAKEMLSRIELDDLREFLERKIREKVSDAKHSGLN